jgi:hypothetical protein
MKPHVIPILLLTVVVIALAGSLIYYINLSAQYETDDTTSSTGTTSTPPTTVDEKVEDFSCSKDEYKDTKACLYPDPKIIDVELPSGDFKTGLPQTIIVTLYNAGKSTTSGYEMNEFYVDPDTQLRNKIGGVSVSGIHNSGQEKKVNLIWVPSVTGRYKYIIKLNKLEDAGVPGVILEKGLTEWSKFVKIIESEMACQASLNDNDEIIIQDDEEKCDIAKSSKILGEKNNAGYVNLETGGAGVYDREKIYVLVKDHAIAFEGALTGEGMKRLRFTIDGEFIETDFIGVGETTTLEFEDIECNIELVSENTVKILKSPKCNIKSDDLVEGRTDIIIEDIMGRYVREVTLEMGQFTVINQEVVKFKDLIKDTLFQTFYPSLEVDGEKIEGNEVPYNSMSVFGK